MGVMARKPDSAEGDRADRDARRQPRFDRPLRLALTLHPLACIVSHAGQRV